MAAHRSPRCPAPPTPTYASSACVLAAEVIMFDNIVTVYRNSADVWFYVTQLRLKSATARHTGLLGRSAAGLARSTRTAQRPPSPGSLGAAAARPPGPHRGRPLRAP